MKTYSSQGLMVGIALVAVHGLIRERVAFLRHWSDGKDVDWSKDNVLNGLRACYEAIQKCQDFVTADTDVTDVLAHACQTARIDLDDWEKVIKVTPAT